MIKNYEYADRILAAADPKASARRFVAMCRGSIKAAVISPARGLLQTRTCEWSYSKRQRHNASAQAVEKVNFDFFELAVFASRQQAAPVGSRAAKPEKNGENLRFSFRSDAPVARPDLTLRASALNDPGVYRQSPTDALLRQPFSAFAAKFISGLGGCATIWAEARSPRGIVMHSVVCAAETQFQRIRFFAVIGYIK